MQITHVVGARPNFMKVAPVIAGLNPFSTVHQRLVHTGQHYDAAMSTIFFQQLGLPEPDVNLGVGSGSHAVQTAQIMTRFEEVMLAERPDMVLVYGDVNSTVAAALVCAKLHIPVGHVEAGLRSFDRAMPEEINRLLTDQIADMLFTPSADGNDNLAREGVAPERVHLVGNVMIDTLLRLLPQAEAAWPALCQRLQIDGAAWQRYALVTLHRPSNVDATAMLQRLEVVLRDIAEHVPLIFPLHPRTRQRLATLGLSLAHPNILLTEPLSYLDFLALEQHAALVVSDSGGVQEETTLLGVPCLTVRENTERPITVTLGTNKLVGSDTALLYNETLRLLNGEVPQGRVPPLWDGNAGARIAEIIAAAVP